MNRCTMKRHAERRSNNGHFAGYPPKLFQLPLRGTIPDAVLRAKVLSKPSVFFLRRLGPSSGIVSPVQLRSVPSQRAAIQGCINSLTRTIFYSKHHAFNRLEGNN